MRGEEKLPGAEEAVRRWRCCGRGWWRWRSSRTAAPGGAAAVPNVRFPFLPMFRSSLFLPFPLFSQSVFLSSVFFLCFSLLSVSLFFRFFLSLSSVFLFSPSPPSPLLCFFLVFSLRPFPSPPFAAVLAAIYRAKWVAFRCGAWGAAGRSAIGRDCQRSAPLPGFLAGARWVVGHCVRSVGSRREWPAKIQKKDFPFSFFPAACSGGRRKMNSVVQNDTVLLSFFFLNVWNGVVLEKTRRFI